MPEDTEKDKRETPGEEIIACANRKVQETVVKLERRKNYNRRRGGRMKEIAWPDARLNCSRCAISRRSRAKDNRIIRCPAEGYTISTGKTHWRQVGCIFYEMRSARSR